MTLFNSLASVFILIIQSRALGLMRSHVVAVLRGASSQVKFILQVRWICACFQTYENWKPNN